MNYFKRFLVFILIILSCANVSFTQDDIEFNVMNPFNGSPDATRTDTGIDKQWLRIDLTNDPGTGDFEILKATPEIKITDIGDSNSARWVRTDTLGQMNLYNTAYKPGGTGNALDFDGDDYIAITNSSDFDFTTTDEISVSAWINPTTSADFQTVLAVFGGGVKDVFALQNSRIVFNGVPGVNRIVNRSGANPTTWAHIGFTYSKASGTLTFYANGVSNGTPLTGLTDDFKYAPTQPLVIGNLVAATPSQAFTGLIDEVVIWGRELSANDMLDEYNAGAGLFNDKDNNFPTDGGSIETNLAAIWHHDESAMNSAPGGTDTTDSSANSNHGTAEASMTDGDFVTGQVNTVGADVETSIIQHSDGLDGNQGYVLKIGDATNPGEMICYGDEYAWNINGSSFMTADNNGTLIIDNGVTTAQQLILRAAASASENIFEAQDSSSNIGFAIEEDFDIIQGLGATGKDYTYTFDGETNDGIFTWMEDEDYFNFSDTVKHNAGEIVSIKTIASAQSPYTVLSSDRHISVNPDGAITINLPAITATNNGQKYTVKDGYSNASTNNITITSNGTDTIDNAANFILIADDESVDLIANNTTSNWEIF